MFESFTYVTFKASEYIFLFESFKKEDKTYCFYKIVHHLSDLHNFESDNTYVSRSWKKINETKWN